MNVVIFVDVLLNVDVEVCCCSREEAEEVVVVEEEWLVVVVVDEEVARRARSALKVWHVPATALAASRLFCFFQTN